jgi:CheY-like chemotaxis protein
MPHEQLYVVDDKGGMRDVAGLSLHQLKEGWTATTANGGAAVTAIDQSMEPYAILLGVKMPDIDLPSTFPCSSPLRTAPLTGSASMKRAIW